MARVKMVTRSFFTTKVKAIVFNNETNKTGEEEFVLTGEYKTDESALKALKNVTSEKVQALKILSRETDSALYGIEEAEFIKLAKKLEGRNNKVIEEPAENAE